MRYLVSVREAAQLAHLPVRTVHAWATSGKVTTVRRGERGTLVDFDEVCKLRELRFHSGRLPRRVSRVDNLR